MPRDDRHRPISALGHSVDRLASGDTSVVHSRGRAPKTGSDVTRFSFRHSKHLWRLPLRIAPYFSFRHPLRQRTRHTQTSLLLATTVKRIHSRRQSSVAIAPASRGVYLAGGGVDLQRVVIDRRAETINKDRNLWATNFRQARCLSGACRVRSSL